MSVEIREIIIQAILEQDQDPEAAARARRVLEEGGDFETDFVKKKKKKKKKPFKDASGKEVEPSENQEEEEELEEEEEEEEAGEDEFMDERESIINECLDRVRDLLEKQMFR